MIASSTCSPASKGTCSIGTAPADTPIRASATWSHRTITTRCRVPCAFGTSISICTGENRWHPWRDKARWCFRRRPGTPMSATSPSATRKPACRLVSSTCAAPMPAARLCRARTKSSATGWMDRSTSWSSRPISPASMPPAAGATTTRSFRRATSTSPASTTSGRATRGRTASMRSSCAFRRTDSRPEARFHRPRGRRHLLPRHPLLAGEEPDESDQSGPVQHAQGVRDRQYIETMPRMPMRMAAEGCRVEHHLRRQQPAVEPQVRETEVGCEEKQLQERRSQPERFVRHRLEPERITKRIEQPAVPGEELKRARDGPHFSDELVMAGGGCRIVGPRRGFQAHAVAAPDDPERNQHIVENRIVGNWLEQYPPDRVNRARRADGRIGPALASPDELLVPPVEARALSDRGALCRRQHQLPADGADHRIRKVRNQGTDRVTLEALTRICQHDNLAARRRDDVIQHGRLAPPFRECSNLHAGLLVQAGSLDRAVRRTV